MKHRKLIKDMTTQELQEEFDWCCTETILTGKVLRNARIIGLPPDTDLLIFVELLETRTRKIAMRLAQKGINADLAILRQLAIY